MPREQEWFACDRCTRWFRSEDALWQHEQAKHVDEEDEQEPKKCENEQEPSSGEYTYETCYTYESEVGSGANWTSRRAFRWAS